MRVLCVAVAGIALAGDAAPEWSFDYAGKPAAFELRETKTLGVDERKVRTAETYVSPDGRLALRVTRTAYRKFPAKEYLPEFVVLGDKSTEIVSDFRSVDMALAGAVGIRALTGTKCTANDFTPKTAKVGPGAEKEFRMVATEGRSSADWMPFWGVDGADGTGRELAIGWSGAWRADFTAQTNGVRMTAGMLETHFRLLPGETLRMPSVLVFERAKDVSPVAMKTLVHRFMIDEKSPRDAKGALLKPLLPLTAGGGNKTPAMMKHMIDWKAKEKMPFDCYWVDAGWNGPAHQPDTVSNCGFDWWKYVGDWRMNPTVHPDGNLASVADAAHAAGMKMLLWVEPERCTTKPFVHPVTKAHRDWFLPSEDKVASVPGADANLCHNLGNPAACDYVIELVSKLVRENKLDVYRQDFNFNTIPYWKSADAPDRTGVTEAKYVAGLYRFWDTLRERFPNLLIENCASGGRRLDFEAISRSHSYCRTDFVIGFRGDPVQVTDAQNCTYNTLAFQPFQGGETRPASMFDDYGFFSTVCAASVFTPSDWFGDRAPNGAHNGGLVTHDFTAEENGWIREVCTVADRMRPFYEGDFHPLCGAPRTQSEREWCAWQLHRADLDSGFAIVFRRIAVDDRYFTCRLGGIDPEGDYEVEFHRGETKTVKGAALASLAVDVPRPRDFKLFFYRRKAVEKITEPVAEASSATPERIVFLEAHPDDLASEMGTVLLMRDRYEVHVIDYTHGERGCGEEKFTNGWTRAKRTAEETRVCAAVGAKLHWLEEIDGEAYAGRQSVAALARLLKEIRPRAVVMHWPMDTHDDHVMSFAAGMKAIALAGLEPEIYYHLQESQARGFNPFVYVDVTSVLDRKNEIISFYACQDGDRIAERKTKTQWVSARAVRGWKGGYCESYGVMPGTVRPDRCVFATLPGATF